MKKTYISPIAMVTDIDAEQLICVSQKLFDGPALEGADLADDRDDYDDEEDLW